MIRAAELAALIGNLLVQKRTDGQEFMRRIAERFKKLGGMTAQPSKKIGM